MKPKVFSRLAVTLVTVLFFVVAGLAQNSSTQNSQNQNKQDQNQNNQKQTSKSDNTSNSSSQTPTAGSMESPAGAPVSQLTGVVSSVNRHDGTTMFEIKVKDSNGKKHEVFVSPSAIIKQGDQKVAGTTLQKGANVQIEAYTTPSGSMTAKTITITDTTAASRP
ncbi:MAG TPA: hypothetical protein VFC63_15595 [Blastocatellia bacterium]|nr:hypothetical protein [Blastocatellia bacterium]